MKIQQQTYSRDRLLDAKRENFSTTLGFAWEQLEAGRRVADRPKGSDPDYSELQHMMTRLQRMSFELMILDPTLEKDMQAVLNAAPWAGKVEDYGKLSSYDRVFIEALHNLRRSMTRSLGIYEKTGKVDGML